MKKRRSMRAIHLARPAALILGVLCVFTVSCRPMPPVVPVAEWRLASGRTVSDVVPSDPGTVLLVFSPESLFRCMTILPDWLEQRRTRPDRIKILLTREPTESQRTELLTRRIGHDVLLHPEFSSRSVQPPEVYVLRGDRVLYHSSLKSTRFATPMTDSILAYPLRDPAEIVADVRTAREEREPRNDTVIEVN